MLTIYKYPLKPITEQTIELPTDSKILTAQVQHRKPMLLAMVTNNKQTAKLLIRIVCTGEQISEDKFEGYTYLSTYQMCDGDFIHHVFYKWI